MEGAPRTHLRSANPPAVRAYGATPNSSGGTERRQGRGWGVTSGSAGALIRISPCARMTRK